MMLDKIWKIFELILRKITYGILNLAGVKLSDEKWNDFMQFVKFGLVGVSNTVISYVVYVVFVYLGVNYVISNIISFVVSVLNSFYWNNKYVFKVGEDENRSALKSLAKTFIAYGFTGLILSNILLVIWVKVFKISKYIAPLINLIATIPINYLINKFWAFRKKEA